MPDQDPMLEYQSALAELLGRPVQIADRDDLKAIAEQRPPKPWMYTAHHPIHGDLTFRAARLPVATEILAHRVRMDNLLAALSSEAREGTGTLAAAIAGVGTLVEAPVAGKTTKTDPLDPARTVIEIVYYDAASEVDEAFLTNMWMAFSAWRQSFVLQRSLDTLGESSGETAGSGSVTGSAEPTVSPSTILD